VDGHRGTLSQRPVAHVTSQLSAQTSWTTFFQQLNGQIAPAGHAAVTQQMLVNVSARPGDHADLSALPIDEGADIRSTPSASARWATAARWC
jgi:hypothetical protein